MRKNAIHVLDSFAGRRSANGDSKRTIHTDGETVYSYAMAIMRRRFDGSIVLVAYADAPTATTRAHVRACETRYPEAVRVPRDAVLRREPGEVASAQWAKGRAGDYGPAAMAR